MKRDKQIFLGRGEGMGDSEAWGDLREEHGFPEMPKKGTCQGI